MKWITFKAGDLFTIINNPQLDKNNFVFSKHAEYPYFTRTVNNNGILGYVDYLDNEHLIPGNSLAVGMIAMQFFYMGHDFYAGQFTKTAIPKFEGFDERIAMYFITLFNVNSESYKGGLVRNFTSLFENTKLLLPSSDDITPDFEYMRERIAELERERIAELEAYLEVTGLKDYELTLRERETLRLKPLYKAFKLGELFEIKSPIKRFNANAVSIFKSRIGRSHPYVVRTSVNNGQRGYIEQDEQFLSPGNTIAFGQDTATAFYQSEDYFTGDKIKVLSLKSDYGVLTENNACFIICAIRKGSSNLKWGVSSFNEEKIRDLQLYLPTSNGTDPDYEYMETYIRSQEKLVIRDVVKYKNTIIEDTKKIIDCC